MTSGAVTSDEIREGLSAFFADVDLDDLKSKDIAPDEIIASSDFASARQLDASDFIIDSMDVVADEPVSESSPHSSGSDEIVEQADSAGENEADIGAQLAEPEVAETFASEPALESEAVSEAVSEPDVEYQQQAEKERSARDTLVDELNLHEALLDDVDIDLFGDDADTSGMSTSDMSASGTSDTSDSTVDEQHPGEQDFMDTGTIETDLDHSVQLVAGELQPVVSSALVVNQKTAEIAEYYPAIDPLDSTQSDFDLDIPDAPVPGGFLRRWYIRGVAYLKQMWRRIRRAKSDSKD